MTDQINSEFNDVISSLHTLQEIKAPGSIVNNLRKRLPHNPTHSSWNTLFVPRVALVIILFLLLSTGSVIAASMFSQPGELLYPVKQAVETLTNSDVKKQDDKTTQLPMPTPFPSLLHTDTPVPTVSIDQASGQQEEQNVSAHIEIQPQAASQPSPTPTDAFGTSVNLPTVNTSVSVSLGAPSVTPEPSSAPIQGEVATPLPLPLNLDVSLTIDETPLVKLGL